MSRIKSAGLALLFFASLAAAPPGTVREVWHDAARHREGPVKIDVPANGATPWPVVILSHGLGGSREGLATIGRYWADHGYAVVHLQHAGSDEAILRAGPMADLPKRLKGAETGEQLVARTGDVTFALDELARRNADPTWSLHGKLDLNRVAMAGHSFGAVTTQAMCGQRYPGGTSFYDKRIKAGVIFSPSPPRVGDATAAFARMRVPLFHFTGTDDRTPAMAGNVTPAQRRVPFDVTTAVDQYLVVITGGDHMLFNGRNRGPRPGDVAPLDLIGQGSTAFLDKVLKGDVRQATFLDGGGYAAVVKPLGTFECKSTAGRKSE